MILYLMFIAVASNHLGLISAIEERLDVRFEIINCPRCLSFWLTLAYLLFHRDGLIYSLAMSFFVSYLAIWTELAMGMLDHFYNKIYEKIYEHTYDKATDDTDSPDKGDGDDPMPDMQRQDGYGACSYD